VHQKPSALSLRPSAFSLEKKPRQPEVDWRGICDITSKAEGRRLKAEG